MTITSGTRLTPSNVYKLNALPSIGSQVGNGANTIVSSAATWAVLPTYTCDVTMTNPSSTHNMVCLVSLGAWMVANGTNLRLCVGATGGMTIAGGPGNGWAYGWGEVLFQGNTNTSVAYQRQSTCPVTIPAGASAVTFKAYAYRDAASGTTNVNYPTLRVIPLMFL